MRAFLTLILFTGCLTIMSGQIVINELIPPNTIEIRNLGGSTVDISGYTLSQFPTNNILSEITLICGDNFQIEGGTLIAVTTTFAFNGTDGELALYLMNGDFDNPENIVDYLEWGSHGHTRSSVAEAAGIWTDGDFIEAWDGCASLEYDGGGDASTDWISQDMPSSPCEANTLDGCSGSQCSIISSGLSGVQCQDNGTPSDGSDDIIAFILNPTGVDLAATYSVEVSIGSVEPATGAFGGATSFSMQPGSAGAGNVLITIIDDEDTTCTFEIEMTDPGVCSNICEITDPGLSGIFCNDNDTPSDGSDDFFMFNLDPEGFNLDTAYTVAVSSGTVMPAGGNYGILTTFDLEPGSAGNGDITVTLIDSGDSGCTFEILVPDPGTCSGDCEIVSAGITDVDCDDNGTMTIADDFITFSLDPSGGNLGSLYSVVVSNGTITPDTGMYGEPMNFSLNEGSAGAGNVTITLTDNEDTTCTLDVLINDPGPCSETCNLISTGLSNVICNDNGSPIDESDDFISFTLNPTGNMLGSTYSVAVSAGAVTPLTGSYGSPTQFTMNNGSAGSGNFTVTVTDEVAPQCTEIASVTDPGVCSGACTITNPGLDTIACNDSGTPSDPSDDFIVFALDPTGFNLGTHYVVSASIGTVTPDTAGYGSLITFELGNGTAGSGDITITLTDTSDTECTTEFILADPGSCSDVCNLISVGMNSMACNNNDTPGDASDDYLAFTLNPSGMNLSGNYLVSVSMGVILPDTGSYGLSTEFTMQEGSAGGGNFTLTVTDIGDPECTLDVLIVDPGSCSVPCEITSFGLDSINCNNNGTKENPNDDFIVFILGPSGSGLGTFYTIDVDTGMISPMSGLYNDGTIFTLDLGSAGDGDVVITLTDSDDTNCTAELTITDPGPCSQPPCDAFAGEIESDGPAEICVDDGITDSIGVMVTGSGLDISHAWIITDTNGIFQSIYPRISEDTIFSFEGQDPGVCVIWNLSWDGPLTGLSQGESADSLAGCFDLSNFLTITKFTGEDCETAVFDPKLASLIRVFPVPASDMVFIESRDIAIQYIRIVDVLGRTMKEVNEYQPSKIDLAGLNCGLYYFLIETDRGWAAQRISVKR